MTASHRRVRSAGPRRGRFARRPSRLPRIRAPRTLGPMPAFAIAAAVATLAALAAPAPAPKQSWDATVRPEGYAAFLPHTAVVEVDGTVRGRGSVQLEVTDPKQKFR